MASVGDPGDLVLDFLSQKYQVSVGQVVVTAGSRSTPSESLYPPNIPIGTVIKVDPAELNTYQRVHLQPYADFQRLEYVQVLTRP